MNVLFLDNDIYYVLAATDTLDQFLSILGIRTESVYILPELKWVVHNHTRKYSPEQRARCCDFYNKFQEAILTQREEDLLPALLQVNGVDNGEARLLARLSNEDDGALLTKDTRFVAALSKTGLDIQSKVRGKIIILEHILFALYFRYGHAYIVRKFSDYIPFDKKLISILSSINQENEDSFKEGLDSNIRRRLIDLEPFLFSFEELKNRALHKS